MAISIFHCLLWIFFADIPHQTSYTLHFHSFVMHWVQLVLPIWHGCKIIHWSVDNIKEATCLKRTDCPSPNSHQLPIVPAKVGVSRAPPPCWNVGCLYLVLVLSHSWLCSWIFISRRHTLQKSSLSTGSYKLSPPSNVRVTGVCGRKVDTDVPSLTMYSLIFCRVIHYVPLYYHCLLY